MVNGKKSSSGVGIEETAAYSNSYSLAAARRLLGMDESDMSFSKVLDREPHILVEDFDEDKLGLLRLSFNLNPAMVTKVMAWNRSMF